VGISANNFQTIAGESGGLELRQHAQPGIIAGLFRS
jgi:hypothetical protein